MRCSDLGADYERQASQTASRLHSAGEPAPLFCSAVKASEMQYKTLCHFKIVYTVNSLTWLSLHHRHLAGHIVNSDIIKERRFALCQNCYRLNICLQNFKREKTGSRSFALHSDFSARNYLMIVKWGNRRCSSCIDIAILIL